MTSKIFVGNLPFQVDERQLEDAFSPYGEIQELKVVTDRETGRSRGFGFITYSNGDEAKKAIAAMNDAMLEGRPLRVNLAEERKGGNGGDRGGRRGDKWE